MKVINTKDLPEDRLSTTDEKGWRVYLFPAAVSGFWRNRRTFVQTFLIALFLVGPWITVGGHQIVLLDIPKRKFALFGLTFWAHDTPILFFVLLILGVGLALLTAVWGRIWCGWACPQTVFIDGVFRRIERWVVGNHTDQMKLAKDPMSFKKFSKLSLKWSLFILVGLVISHSFLAYFVGSKELWPMITSDPRENWVSFLVMFFVTFILVFDFAWFREQFCVIMCPYGRFQSLLMDKHSLAVMYDEKRGEPRKGKVLEGQTQGDCINCYKCVACCPTGIDIRRGVQMECIACTACMDACDDVMVKLKRPKGLIRYSSHSLMNSMKRKLIHSRVYLYSFFLLLGVSGLSYAVWRREALEVTVLRGKDTPYEVIQSGEYQGLVMNHFKLHLHNQEFDDLEVFFEEKNDSAELIAPMNPVFLKPGESLTVPLFIRYEPKLLSHDGDGDLKIYFSAKTNRKNIQIIKDAKLVGPLSKL